MQAWQYTCFRISCALHLRHHLRLMNTPTILTGCAAVRRSRWLASTYPIPAAIKGRRAEPVATEGNACVQLAALISIFLVGFCAFAVFGKVTVRTFLDRSAAILSRSTPCGSAKARWNEP